MIRAVSTIALTLAANPVLATCDALLAGNAKAAADMFAPDPATCRTARETTGEALFCFSTYPFRSETALTRAAVLETELTACFGPMDVSQDTAVNHPDSYDARHFDVDGARISLSVKDKGALGKTLVFLRIVKAN